PPPGGRGSPIAKPGEPGKKRPIKDANIEDITNENYPELIDSFDYPNAEITDIVKAISELTGKNFIIDPGVRGKITIIAPSKITVAEAYKAFLSALAINGFTVVPSGKFLKIRNVRDAQRENIETYSGAYSPDSDQMITRIVHLKHTPAAEVVKNLRMLPSKNGEMYPYEPTNSLIISDFGSNIERVMAIIREIDVPGFDEQMEVIRIKNARAKDIADLMDQIINKGSKKGANAGGFSAGIPRFGSPQGKGSNEAFSLVIPDDRTNSIIVVGNKQGIAKIRDLVDKLDRKIRPEEAGGVFVYYVKNGDAEKIATTLNGLAQESNKAQAQPINSIPGIPPLGGGPESSGGAPPLFGGQVKVTASKETNALIITASKQDYAQVLNLLRKIDIIRDQVYVEAIIMEMSVGNVNNYGIAYYQFDKDSNGAGRAGFNGFSGLDQLLNPAATGGAVLGFGSGDKVDIKGPGGTTLATVTSSITLLNFLKSVTNTNILSTPQILAMDNEEATIEVGDEVPIGTQASQGTATTQTSIITKDATIALKIKPHISKTDNTIRIEYDQKVQGISDKPIKAKNLADSAAILSKRTLKSQIVMRSGDTAVLGGLMQDVEGETVRKVPLLGDIPILGWLFKGKDKRKEKVNLLVLLTPRIIRNKGDSKKLLGDKLRERVEFITTGLGGRDPFGKAMAPLKKKATTKAPEDDEKPVRSDDGVEE
ncbi:MAG: type II secretion system secretin GspD, partial [Bdellovibrionia bacterium]